MKKKTRAEGELGREGSCELLAQWMGRKELKMRLLRETVEVASVRAARASELVGAVMEDEVEEVEEEEVVWRAWRSLAWKLCYY